MAYESVWQSIAGSYMADSPMDAKFVPISARDKEILELALHKDMQEGQADPNVHPNVYPNLYRVDPSYWLERLEATHFCISVAIPDEYDENPEWFDTECTHWDFSCILAKQVDGEWHIWSEDPSDVGNIWYQSTYYKNQAFQVRDLCVEWAEKGELYDDFVSSDEWLESDRFYEATKVIMGW